MTARRSTGSVIERALDGGVVAYHLRFTAYGRRRQYSIGTTREGVTRESAEQTLHHILGQVRSGEWIPPEAVQPPKAAMSPGFSEFADEWIKGVEADGKAESTVAMYEWGVSYLKDYFGSTPLDQITPRMIDSYRRELIARRESTGEGLSNNSFNKTIYRLRQILDEAVEAELIDSNPAIGKKRRAPSTPPDRTWIRSAEAIEALLRAAGGLDRRRVKPGRDRLLVAMLIFTGQRISEALAMRWRDVDLDGNRLHVNGTKTHAARRVVNILPVLADELLDYLAVNFPAGPPPDELIFRTSGRVGRESPSNVRDRVIGRAEEVANAELVDRGLRPMDHLTNHSMRRTFASLLTATGENPAYVASQLGHRRAAFTLEVYADVMNDRGLDRARLNALVNGDYLALNGAIAEEVKSPELVAA